MNNKTAVRTLCLNAMIAAVYAALTMALPVLSYNVVQVRLAEGLTVLPFLLPETIPGLVLGCAVANLASSFCIVDVVVGTTATLLAGLLTARAPNKYLAPLPPVILNALLVGAELTWFQTGFGPGALEAFGLNALSIAAGELVACYLIGMLIINYLPGTVAFRRWKGRTLAGR